MTATETLLHEILAFCELRRISPSYFGWLAVNDGKLVPRIQKGQSVTLEKATQIRNFIASYKPRAEVAA